MHTYYYVFNLSGFDLKILFPTMLINYAPSIEHLQVH